MRYRTQIISTVATIGFALAIGAFMQQSATADRVYGAKDGPRSLPKAEEAVLDLRAITLTSGELTAPSPEQDVHLPVTPAALLQHDGIAAAPEVTRAALPGGPLAPEGFGQDTPPCDVTAAARPMAAAMVNLTLEASCLPDERVTVLHEGLLFTELTDADGVLDVVLPAMRREAMFVLAFGNGEGAVAQTIVDGVAQYDRVALQWKGSAGFELHAREFGARYGDAGHVWAQATRDMSFAVTGAGGFLSRLGNPSVPDGLMAEVYTFPIGDAQQGGEIDLSIETRIAAGNCGQEIEAKALQTKRGAEITSRRVTLSVPDCEAEGTFLVLNNIFQDLKVASN